MSILRTIAMFIYLFGYMILHYGILRRAERAAAAGDTATVEQIVNQHIPRWSRGILKVTGVSLSVDGLENIPKDRPCVFVANHRSYYDIPLLLAGLEKPHGILAKEELEKIPLLNRWMKLLGCVFVQRDDVRASVRALNDATAIVESGRSFVIFPEGTRYKGEEGGAGEFKAGAFRIAVKTSAPVVPVAVTGARALFEANGVPHTKWVAANRWEIEKDLEGVCAGVEQKLGWPVFVKPANAGSSVGISKVSNQEELKAAIALALENDRKVVFEAFVDGQEVECAVIGSDPAVATRPGEILAGAEFYTYDDKYKNGVSQTVIPAHLPEAKLDEVKTYAAMAYTALNCEGLARCDFFVEKNTGRVLINEINTFPGFTAISMYPKLMEHEGLPVPQLIDRLIALAVERTEKQHG